jgi:hypothetical protein
VRRPTWRGGLVAGCSMLAVMALAAPPTAGALSPRAAVPAPCTSSELAGSVVKVINLAGGTTVVVALTNERGVACEVSGFLTVQFVAKSGAALGMPATSPVLPTVHLLRPTHQARVSVSTIEGVLCTSRSAASIRVNWYKVVRVIRLPSPVGVCVNGVTHWTSVSRITFT